MVWLLAGMAWQFVWLCMDNSKRIPVRSCPLKPHLVIIGMTLATIEIEWRSCDLGGHRTEPDFAATRFFIFCKVPYSSLAPKFMLLSKNLSVLNNNNKGIITESFHSANSRTRLHSIHAAIHQICVASCSSYLVNEWPNVWPNAENRKIFQ